MKKKFYIREKAISNTVFLFLDWATTALLSLVFWMLLGKTFLPQDLGIVAASRDLIFLVASVSSLGIARALQKLVPEVKQTEGLKGVYPLVKFSIKSMLISLIVVSLLMLLFKNQLSQFTKIPQHALLISIFSIIAVSVYEFLGSVLYGLQKMKQYFLTNFLQIIIRIVFLVLFLFSISSYFNNYIYLIPLTALFIGYLVIIFLRFDPSYLKSNKSTYSKKLFSYSFPLLISSLAALAVHNSQYIILTILQDTSITGIFAVAFIITSVITVLANIPSTGIFPIISALSTDKKTNRAQGYLIGLSVRYGLFTVVPISALLLIMSHMAVMIFSSEQYLSSTVYFPILIPSAIIGGISGIFASNIYAIGKPKIHRNISLLVSSVFLTLSLILTYYFSAIGLSLALLISMIVTFSLNFIFINKFVKINLFIKDNLKIVIASIISVLFIFILSRNLVNPLGLFFVTLLGGVFYLIILLFLKFYRKEDIKILNYIGEKTPILGKCVLLLSDFLEKRL